jgi:hypothetical protein
LPIWQRNGTKPGPSSNGCAQLRRTRSRAQASRDIELAALRAELTGRIETARRDGEKAGRDAALQGLAEDENGTLATARAEWEDELNATVVRVRAEAAAEAKEAQARTLGAAVEAARAEWRSERQQIEAQFAAELESAQKAAEAAKRALDDARTGWEADKQRLLADADARIAAAGSGDTTAASAEAERRDEAVGAALAEAERRWQRELDIQVDAAEKRIAAMRVAAETELDAERERAVRTALAEARTRWEAEVAERLAEAEANWQAESNKRLATAQAELEGDFTRRLSRLEARIETPAPTAAASAAKGDAAQTKAKPDAAKPGKADARLARTIAQWNRTHRRRRKLPLPHIPRRLAWASVVGALIVGGGVYYQKGIGLWQKYAPVVDAEVAPQAAEVTAQARQIAALVEAAIRERLPAPPPAEEAGIPETAAGDDPLAALRRAWVKPEIANLRAEPSADGSLVTTLPRGVEIEQIGVRGAWIRVRALVGAKPEGWMHASVLTSTAPK